MSASPKRPKSGARRCFGLVIFFLAMMPTPVGFQDLAALIARQPVVSDRWRQYVRVSPFGTVQAATFSFPQPLGTLIPVTPGYTFASLDPRALDITGSIGNPRLNPLAEPAPPIQFPAVNRTLKGDLLVPRERSVAPAEPQPAKDKPKKVPEKTQDRAQIEEPKAVPAPKAEPVTAQPAPQVVVPEPAKPQTADAAQDPGPATGQDSAQATGRDADKDVVQAQPETAAPEAPKPEVAVIPEMTPVPAEEPAQVAAAPAVLEPMPQVAVQQPAEAEMPLSPTPESSPELARITESNVQPGVEPQAPQTPEARQADAEILTDDEPVDSDVAIRSDIKR